MVRAICSPFNPDNAVQNVLRPYETIKDENFVINILKDIHDSTIKIIEYSTMPTPEQNIAFINSMREHYKNIKLSIIDKKSEDDRKVLNQLKKIIEY